MKRLPNHPSAANPAIAVPFHSKHQWRGVAGRDRYASAMIRVIQLTVLLLVCESVYAHHVTYSASCRFVEERCATNRTPQDERVYVLAGDHPSIVRFHHGITLREIIDLTSFKGKTAWICVLRSSHPVLDHWTRVGRKDKPKDEVKPQDLILLNDNGMIIEI
jgi:hypothetical protein